MKLDLDELERMQFHDAGAGPQMVRALIRRVRELEEFVRTTARYTEAEADEADNVESENALRELARNALELAEKGATLP